MHRRETPPQHFKSMINNELTLDQLQAISGGNCADTDKKKKVKISFECEERRECPEDDLVGYDRKKSDLKKSSKPIPYTDNGVDGWQTER